MTDEQTEQAVIPAAKDPNRNRLGRFVPGNKAAVGNTGGRARHKEAARFDRAVAEAVTDDELVQIVRRAVLDAMDGDRYAREWLWDRVVGKATTRVESSPENDQFTQLLAVLVQIEGGEGAVEVEG